MKLNVVDSVLLNALRPERIRDRDHDNVASYWNALQERIQHASDEQRPQLERWQIRRELPPIAYDGSPHTAKVLYLNSNPSFGDDSTPGTHFQPHPDWPLSVAGPHIHAPTKIHYQEKVFRHLQEAGVSLDAIGRKLLKVELVPWATKEWPKESRLQRQLSGFPSLEPISMLVRSLVEQGAIVIVKSGHWCKVVPLLDELRGKRVFVSRAPAGYWISKGTYPEGWDLLLEAFRIE
jgi:hypothetical protein